MTPQRITDAARQLFARRGLGVTLNEIAREAGVDVNSVHSPGPDIDGVMKVLLDQRLDELLGLTAVARSDGQPLDRVTEAGDSAPWLRAFREILSERLGARAASLPAVARHLTVSSRTLQRQLEQHGTNWRAEIDAVRREQAARLSRTGAKQEVIAARLGYSDTRALRRAVQRWNRQHQSN
jgi:AcrR family transcriptional regulator